MAKVFVVIPNWNGIDYLDACLKSILNQSIRLSIVVVDNGSIDGSAELLEKKYQQVDLIRLAENTGFTGGVNAGINRALSQKADYVALFNNDAVADKKWAENLLKAAIDNPGSGIVTGKFLRIEGERIDSTGEQYSTRGLPFSRGRNQLENGQYDNQVDVFGATGGASLYSAKMLKEVGLFDQSFFAYFEDVDISFRSQLMGWKVTYEPSAIAYHHIGATSSKLGDFSRYHSAKNFILCYTKNMPGQLYFKYLPLFLMQLMRWSISSLLKGKTMPFLKGLFSAVWLLPNAFIQRHFIQSNRKVSIAYIDSILYHHRPPRPPKIR
ncbi:MAG: glycosyltransferase family 2 protein [bacterium]